MDINITTLSKLDCFDLSHSRFEGGENAGRNTWNASLKQADETPLLDTPEKLRAMRAFALDSGGWNREEVNKWTPKEVNALFLQWIANDTRELNADSLEEIDWDEAEELQREGNVSSNLFRGSDGQIYFYLGC